MEIFSKIIITMSNGKVMEYHLADFERYGNELEHKEENIIINTEKPKESFIYELSKRKEIENKDYIVKVEFVK